RLNVNSKERFRERAKNQRSRRVCKLAQAEAYATENRPSVALCGNCMMLSWPHLPTRRLDGRDHDSHPGQSDQNCGCSCGGDCPGNVCWPAMVVRRFSSSL